MDKFKKFLRSCAGHTLRVLRGIGAFLLKVWNNPKGRRGVIMVGIVAFIAIFAPLLTPYSLDDYNVSEGLQHPSAEHWLGTDKNGVDILTQLMYGARISLIIGITTGLCVTLLGAILGIVSAYFGRIASGIIVNIINVLLVIPTLPLMMVLANVSSSYLMMIAVFTLIGWCGTARMVRAQVHSIVGMNYVRAAELSGGGKSYIMFKHIMPAIAHLLIMNCALSCAGFMIAEAGLSFIGIGDASVMSWGKILVAAETDAFTSKLWAWILAPGAAIFFTVYGFMQIGYALEEIFNPRMKRTRYCVKNTDPMKTEAEIFLSMNDMSYSEADAIKKSYAEGGDADGSGA